MFNKKTIPSILHHSSEKKENKLLTFPFVFRIIINKKKTHKVFFCFKHLSIFPSILFFMSHPCLRCTFLLYFSVCLHRIVWCLMKQPNSCSLLFLLLFTNATDTILSDPNSLRFIWDWSRPDLISLTDINMALRTKSKQSSCYWTTGFYVPY